MTAASGKVDTAVVIVNFRTPELTVEAARSAAKEPEVAEIIIVDNDSGDGSVEILRSRLAEEPRAQVVASAANVGLGRGANLGVERSTAPLVLLLNSDAILRPGSLAVMRRSLLEHEHVGIVAPGVYLQDGRELQPAAHGVFPSLKAIVLRTNHHPPETLWPDWVSGVAMLMRRRDFTAVGGFDPDFSMYLEDVDLCRRMREVGKQVRRELAAGVVHLGGRSWRSPDTQFNQAQRSRILYYHKADYSPVARLAVQAIRVAHLLAQRIPGRRGARS